MCVCLCACVEKQERVEYQLISVNVTWRGVSITSSISLTTCSSSSFFTFFFTARRYLIVLYSILSMLYVKSYTPWLFSGAVCYSRDLCGVWIQYIVRLLCHLKAVRRASWAQTTLHADWHTATFAGSEQFAIYDYYHRTLAHRTLIKSHVRMIYWTVFLPMTLGDLHCYFS